MSSNTLFGGNLKKILLSLMVLGMVTAALGASTFATFNAQTTNGNNTFKTGTLVLSNTKKSEAGAAVTTPTPCYSTGSGSSTDTNANSLCPTLITATGMKPGAVYTATLTLKNEGSLDANVFRVFSSACAVDDAAGETYHGAGNLCDKIQLYIQQIDNTTSADTVCLYGSSSSQSCTFSDTGYSLNNFLTTHTTPETAWDVNGSTLPSGQSTSIRIGMKLPTDADNTYQGRTATVDFNWYIAQ